MKSIFTTESFEEINTRIDNLKNDSNPLWGKMNVSQMCTHCSEPIKIALSEKSTMDNMSVVKKMILSLFKKQMYNDKAWRKNLPTPKKFIVTDERDFDKEKENLKSIILQFCHKKENIHLQNHPLFGKFTTEQWGIMQYKHLDHHLRQFGV